MNVAKLVNGGKTDINITLDKNIDLTGKDWTPIGTDYDNSYKGTFDGGGHTITGLTFTTNDEYAGLFGWLNRAGTVKNVVMEGVQITSHQIYGGSIGGVVGSGWGTIENCSVSGSVSGTVYVGGVVGVQIGGSITGCSSSATVKGMVDVGGVAGLLCHRQRDHRNGPQKEYRWRQSGGNERRKQPPCLLCHGQRNQYG